MPFGHHHQNTANNPAAGIYQAAAALGSIGAPMGNLRVATAGQTSAGTDAFQPSGSLQSPVEQAYSSGGHTAPPAAQSSFDAPRRAPTLSRAPDSELHIATASASAPAPSQQQQQQQQQQNMYNPPDNYAAPNIQLQQATPGNTQYGAPTQPIPNALQPAAGVGQQRPVPSSAYTAPAMVPSQAQIPSNAQQYTLPTRSNTIHQSQPSPHSSHTYSRSSPAGMGPDQKYIPFSNTPEQPKYAPNTPAQKYYPSTPSGATSHSPLGLADIRPRANSSMDQEPGMGHGNAMMTEHNKVPSNSNYLAPWSIYAYDWCKWNVPGGNSAGKMAVGSYLEDNHNFVSHIAHYTSPHANIH
jgi:WD repeat-containing protein 68